MNIKHALGLVASIVTCQFSFAGNVPPGWYTGGEKYNEIGIDESVFNSPPRSYYIQSQPTKPSKELVKPLNTRGILWQVINGEEYAGKRIEVVSFLKSKNLSSSANIYVEAKGENGTLVGAACHIKETTDWKKCPVVIEIPNETKSINVGFVLWGEGKVWIDDIKTEVVSRDISITNPYHPYQPKKLQNLP
jgi:hypothetical protein